MKRILILSSLLLGGASAWAQTNPAITSWLRNTTGIVGRHYVSGNSTPITDTYSANVQTVQYSSSWAYISCSGIPSYVIGPYLDGNPNQGTSNSNIYKIPLTPTQNTGTASPTTGGTIGVFINGVSLFDYRDGVSYSLTSAAEKGGPIGGSGDGVWNRDAVVAERAGFDCAKGHPAGTNYHHHQNPSAFNLDLTVLSTICNLYTSDALYTINANSHSPLLGFAYDGYPIYGAYGYYNTNGTGGIVRMKSSYSLRNIAVRTHYANGTDVTDGPAVSTTYPLGRYREDYQYTAPSAAMPDYLDDHNGRFCVTPEYPNGTYAYFCTVDASHNSAYPYVVGPTFYGVKNVTRVTSITETTTTYSPTNLSATVSKTDVSCFNGSNATITLSNVSGGTAPYTYNWGSGVTTQNRTGLTAGTYAVTITSANAQTATYSTTITQPTAALTASVTGVNVACFGGSTGAVTASATGGTSAYAYNWGSGITAASRTGLASGTYTVTITDANGCIASAGKTITQPASAVSVTSASSNVACFGGSTGTIYLTVSGGTSGYTYNWGNNVTSQNRSGLTAGTYTVSVTDAAGCAATHSKTITQTTAITATGTTTSASCGNANGSISTSISGGTAPYTYNWGNNITTQNRTGLAAGSYTLSTTDANGCTASVNFNVSNSNAQTVTATTTNSRCNGQASGAISLSVAGGTAPYTYNWGSNVTTQNRTGLAAGVYTATVTDANNCLVVISSTVTQPTAITLTNTNQNSSCGQSNGIISVTVLGGTLAYVYNWGNNVTTQNRTGLAAGSYALSVTDANGCTQSLATTISSTSSATVTSTATNVLCFGSANGNVTLSVTGGTAPFTYNWGNNITTQNRSGLTAGTYAVTVTDANGCSAVRSQIVTQPQTVLTATLTATPVSGATLGTVISSATGGTSPYRYQWNTGATASQLTGLAAGTYTLTISDVNNCQFARSATVTNVTGIIEPIENLVINVLPNPADNLIILQAQGLLKSSYSVKLYDITGKMVASKDFLQGSTLCFIESSTLYDGLYVLHVTDGLSTKVFKVEVRH